jgi:hypothetical protein
MSIPFTSETFWAIAISRLCFDVGDGITTLICGGLKLGGGLGVDGSG